VIQWLLALCVLLLMLAVMTLALVALIYLCALGVSLFPLVGRRKSVPGGRTARERVVFRVRE
jgi:hypothetical protein